MLKRVVFPEPLGPRRPTTWCSSMAMSTPRRARSPPKAMERPRPSSSATLGPLSPQGGGAGVGGACDAMEGWAEPCQAAGEIQHHDDQGERVRELMERRDVGVQEELAHQVEPEGRRGGAQQRVEAAEGF